MGNEKQESKSLSVDITELSVEQRSAAERITTGCVVAVGTTVVLVLAIPGLAAYWTYCKAIGHKSRLFRPMNRQNWID